MIDVLTTNVLRLEVSRSFPSILFDASSRVNTTVQRLSLLQMVTIGGNHLYGAFLHETRRSVSPSYTDRQAEIPALKSTLISSRARFLDQNRHYSLVSDLNAR